MSYYDSSDNVKSYIKICADYDGSHLYTVLEKHASKDSTLLELGMGPGNDLDHFAQQYAVTGSDLSAEFLNHAEEQYPHLPLLQLDALIIDTPQQFDVVYSNKVLHHLTLDELKRSCQRQQNVIALNGLFAHTFWIGDKMSEMHVHGLFTLYHQRDLLVSLISDYFEIVELLDYAEFEENDSLFIVARNNKLP